MKMKKRIIISALDSVLNVKEWLNDNIPVMNLTKNGYVKKMSSLVEPQWAANYSKHLISSIPAYLKDEEILSELIKHRSFIGVPLIEGSYDGITSLIQEGLRPVLLFPGEIGQELKSACDLNGLLLPTAYYLDLKAKYCIMEKMEVVVESNINTANNIAKNKIKCVLIDLPWNQGETQAFRAKNWKEAAEWIIDNI